MLAVLLSGGAAWSFGVFFLAWVGRALAAIWVDRALEPSALWAARRSTGRVRPRTADPAPAPAEREGEAGRGPDDLRLEDGMNLADAATQGLAFPCPVWLLPLRDLISVGVMLASYAGRRVEWRGHHMTADTPGRAAPEFTASDRTAPT